MLLAKSQLLMVVCSSLCINYKGCEPRGQSIIKDQLLKVQVQRNFRGKENSEKGLNW